MNQTGQLHTRLWERQMTSVGSCTCLRSPPRPSWLPSALIPTNRGAPCRELGRCGRSEGQKCGHGRGEHPLPCRHFDTGCITMTVNDAMVTSRSYASSLRMWPSAALTALPCTTLRSPIPSAAAQPSLHTVRAYGRSLPRHGRLSDALCSSTMPDSRVPLRCRGEMFQQTLHAWMAAQSGTVVRDSIASVTTAHRSGHGDAVALVSPPHRMHEQSKTGLQCCPGPNDLAGTQTSSSSARAVSAGRRRGPTAARTRGRRDPLDPLDWTHTQQQQQQQPQKPPGAVHARP
ncbi:hypothetical protein BKA81DRAFT_50166 [Phyllosticta paracitricarpa]|uniref:Uncharacterized protein n=1 Tax=Phyllosticta paracitricarpa TaxID=2016321 RepID=A0ABR1NCH4_9PEZI